MFYICLLIAFSCFTFFFSKNYFKKQHIINRALVKATPNYYGICVTTWLLSILALTLIIIYLLDIESIEIFVTISLLLTLLFNKVGKSFCKSSLGLFEKTRVFESNFATSLKASL